MCLAKIKSGRGRRACSKKCFPDMIMTEEKPYEPVKIYRKERESDL